MAASVALLKASPAALDLRREFVLGLGGIAWISSIFTLATVLLGVFVGGWVRRLGATAMIRAGLLALVAGGTGSLLATSAGMLLLGRVIEGIGFVLVIVAAPTLMASLASAAHGRLVLGLWSTWLPAGGIVVMLAAPALLSQAGWRAVWMLSLALAGAVWLALGRAPNVRPQGDGTGGRLTATLRWRQPWLLGIAFALFTVQLYAVLVLGPLYLTRELGYSLPSASLVTSVVLVMAMLGGLFASFVLHRGVLPFRIQAVCFALVGGFIAALMSSAGGLPGLLLLVGYGLCAGAIPPAIYAQAPATGAGPDATGVVLGMIMTGNGLGILVGPPAVAGLVQASGSWAPGTALLVVACVSGILCGWLAGGRPLKQ